MVITSSRNAGGRMPDRAALLRNPAWGWLAVLVAIALLSVALMQLLAVLFSGPSLSATDAPGIELVDERAAQQAPAQSAAFTLSKWHLFGNAPAAVDLAALARTAPETALKLTLRGTLNLDTRDDGIAIIADESGIQRPYRVGDTLPGAARLEAIHASRVLLSLDGRTEGLSLPRELDDSPSAAPRRTAGTSSRRSASGQDAVNGMPSPFIRPTLNTGGPSLESIRDATGIDAAALASQVSVLPVIENGRFAGVRLSAGRDSDLLDRAGIRPSDVVTAVNGIPLDGPQRQQELLTSLRDASQVQLTVRREGRDVQLSVNLK